MSSQPLLSKRFYYTAAPVALLTFAGIGLATAQSSSPFASKRAAQAWEQPAAAPTQSWQAPSAPTYTAPSYNSAPAFTPPQSRPPAIPAALDAPIATNSRLSKPAYTASSVTSPPKSFGGRPAAARATAYPAPAPRAGTSVPPSASSYGYTPPAAPTRTAQAPDFGSPTPPTGGYSSGTSYTPSAPAPRAQTAPQYWTPTPTNPKSSPASAYAPPAQAPQSWESYKQNHVQPSQSSGQYQAQSPYGAPNGYQGGSSVPPSGIPPQGSPYPGGPYTPGPQQPRSWKDKLGLSNLATVLRGAITLGAAATNREQPYNQFGPKDGWTEDAIGDAELEFEVSAITQDGLEYGANLGGRLQYDPFRRGFGGRVPDCPPTVAGCSGQAAGLTTGLRGHTSGFYAAGEDIAKDTQVALESAHLFLRSAYGDVTIGRDDGAAYLFSLGAPSLLAVGASNSPVDYTGYDSVKTVNDASGFAEKITYTSPRLLGDQIGVGVQFGASYALDGDVCGVDYCNGKNITDVTQPEIEDILEVGVALDRTFDNGFGVEWTGTYARGSEKSGVAGLDDLESFGTGLEFTYADWTLGGSYLKSNNGLLDGDYTAYDAGITWKPGALGFTLGYGHAEDDNIGLTSDQGTFGVTYDFNKFTLGTGVQYVDRDVNGLDAAGALTTLDQKAASIFVQGGFKF